MSGASGEAHGGGIYRGLIAVPSIYRGPLAHSALSRPPITIRPTYAAPGVWRQLISVLPSRYWPPAVRAAVVDALARALVRDLLSGGGAAPPTEPSA